MLCAYFVTVKGIRKRNGLLTLLQGGFLHGISVSESSQVAGTS